MASIMKRGNTYSVRYNYKDHNGKPCKGWETFKTKAEAQERKITVEKELLDGTFLVPDAMTVEEMLYKWIPIQSSKHKWSPKTYTQSVAMVQNLIVPYIGKRKVQDLRTYDIEQFYATLSQTPCGQYVHGEKQELTENQKKRLLSSTSIHEVHTLLKTAFSYAVDWDLIHKSPTPREAPKVNTEERTIWDERTMLAALQTIENPALHLAVHLSMILSLREGEILGLQPGDLDFDAADGRGAITVNKAMQRANKEALSKIDPQPDLPHLPGQTGREQVLADSEKDQNQEVQPCPVYDETAERGTSGMARQDEAGRTERPGKVQQLRSAVPLTRRLTHCPGRSDQVVSPVESRAPGV